MIAEIENAISDEDLTFYLDNNCAKPIKFAMRYKTEAGKWKTSGWWNYEANYGNYLGDDNDQEIRVSSPVVYFYAESTSSETRSIWRREGEAPVFFGGKQLQVQLAVLIPKELNSNQVYRLDLVCKNN